MRRVYVGFAVVLAFAFLAVVPNVAAAKGHTEVVICHHGSIHSDTLTTDPEKFHTISVDAHALKGHLKHDDTLGPCPTDLPARVIRIDSDALHRVADMTLAGARR
jgi:hypothetical protein